MTEIPIVVSSESIVVGGILNTIELELDQGPQGQRGSRIFSGPSYPYSLPLDSIYFGGYTSFVQGDLYILTVGQDAGDVYEWSAGTGEWVKALTKMGIETTNFKDTGNRNMVSLVTANGTATYTTVQMRRTGSTVYISLTLANTSTSVTHQLFATLPDGFKPQVDHSVSIYPPNASSASQNTVVSVDSSNGQVQYRNNNAAVMSGVIVYLTSDPWPASLPGVAV